MDNWRGTFGEHPAAGLDDDLWDGDEEEIGAELPPTLIRQDERRMPSQAHDMWVGLRGGDRLPPIAALDINALPSFARYSVVLTYADGAENPGIGFLGDRLAQECGVMPSCDELEHGQAADRSRSLHFGLSAGWRCLSHIADTALLRPIIRHYPELAITQTPVSFSGKFVNQRGNTMLYRGILLPFANEAGAIGQVLGVLNWKEQLDPKTSKALLAEMLRAGEGGKEQGSLQGATTPAPRIRLPARGQG